MTAGRKLCGRRPESGAALLLAIIFVFGVGIVLVPLVSLAGTNMISTSNLQAERGLEFGADAVMDGAIEAVRHQAPTSTCATFPGGATPGLTLDGSSVEVQCLEAPVSTLNPYGRYVEFDACLAKAGETWNTCQSNAIIRTQVSFDDLAPGCTSFSPSSCISYGNQMSVWSWIVRKANA